MFSTITQSLICHPNGFDNSPLRHLDVSICRRRNGDLSLSYRLFASPDAILIPPAAAPSATDGLWQHSCCELFIASAHSSIYEEFNFSPSSQWAHYRFSNYRERDNDFSPSIAPKINWHSFSDGYQLDALLLQAQLPAESPLQVGITAVIEAANNNKSYWALKHCTVQPDFHHRQSFTLTLPD